LRLIQKNTLALKRQENTIEAYKKKLGFIELKEADILAQCNNENLIKDDNYILKQRLYDLIRERLDLQLQNLNLDFLLDEVLQKEGSNCIKEQNP